MEKLVKIVVEEFVAALIFWVLAILFDAFSHAGLLPAGFTAIIAGLWLATSISIPVVELQLWRLLADALDSLR